LVDQARQGGMGVGDGFLVPLVAEFLVFDGDVMARRHA
jgi:hypothetical protein